MSALQRRKGAQGERDLVNFFKGKGLPAKRISMMESGNIDKGDIEIVGKYKVEVKVGGQVPIWMYKARKAGEDLLAFKKDRKQWMIAMDLDFFIENLRFA